MSGSTYKLEWTTELLRRFNDQEFQEVVAELFRRLGYKVTIVGTGGPDAGVDILAEKRTPVREVLAIQCKQQEKPVTVEKIREYSALYNLHDVNLVVLVTSSTFTSPAYEESRRLKVRLLDGIELCKLLQEHLADWLQRFKEPAAVQDQEPQTLAQVPPLATSSPKSSNLSLLCWTLSLFGVFLLWAVIGAGIVSVILLAVAGNPLLPLPLALVLGAVLSGLWLRWWYEKYTRS